jgi:tripartite-type tricarboxylate transporter receptor subunit TctC
MIGVRIAKILGCVAGLGMGFGLLVSSATAEEFPSRPLKIVMGFGAGGLGDTAGRAIAQQMAGSLGKPVIIENMPGAGGSTAAASVARAPADGHTMLWVSGQNAIAPSMFKSLPYNWKTDLTPVSAVGSFAFVIVVKADSPIKTVQDVIAAARKDPDKFNIGCISAGSAQHLNALYFSSLAGIKAPTVHFRTTGEVVAALVAGNVQVGMETLPGVIGQINSGVLRAIAVSTEKRVPALPSVPTAAESGVPDYKVISWNGIVVPAKTPHDIVLRLNRELTKAIASDEVRKRFASINLDPVTSTPEELEKIYQDDLVRWRKVITDAKLQQH